MCDVCNNFRRKEKEDEDRIERMKKCKTVGEYFKTDPEFVETQNKRRKYLEDLKKYLEEMPKQPPRDLLCG